MSLVTGSAVGNSGAQKGSSVQSTPTGTPVANVPLVGQLQANALVDPADSPAKDQARMVYDAAGNVVFYFWRKAASTWVGVQLA